MTTYYHGTNGALELHHGVCFTRDERNASHYGDVHVAEIDLSGLNVERIYFDQEEARQRYENNEYPCDNKKEIAKYISAGIDAIVYDDYDMHGNPHVTLRLLSDKALAAVAVLVD